MDLLSAGLKVFNYDNVLLQWKFLSHFCIENTIEKKPVFKIINIDI